MIYSFSSSLLRSGFSQRALIQPSRLATRNTRSIGRPPRISRISPIRRASTIAETAPLTNVPPAQNNATRSLFRRFVTTTSIFIVFLAAGFSMAAAPAVAAVNGFVKPPSDEESLQLFMPETAFAQEVNEYLVNHPLAKRLRSQPNMSESRAHMKIPLALRENNLTAGVLMGPGKLEVPPLAFNDRDAELPTMEQLSYLGPALCGHTGIAHGGMLATMLDEGLARACFPALPHKVGVTASLKIDYRAPCPAPSYILLRAQTTKVEGRKVWVRGTIESLGDEGSTGTVFAEAEALFIEPRNVASLPKVYTPRP